MDLTLHHLKATGIGKTVSLLENHLSNDISQINDWRAIVAEGVKGATPIANTDDEEGLPSPPMDVEALYEIQHLSMDFTGFFDDIDDDGYPLQDREFSEPKIVAKDYKIRQEMKKEDTICHIKPLNVDLVLEILPKSIMHYKNNIEPKIQQNILKNATSRRHQEFKLDDDDALEKKLEATRRKLKRQYQQVENAKRKRIVKVIELCDLPKQGFNHRIDPLGKPRNHKRQRINGGG